ncbi:MAG: nucleotidyltransferase domain-containing protein [Candidatus Hydrogenedentes bacterium]|nr:nucleotidyltransferase domain-containing protein [Candidatus Hydrogenedentota bacterium]
MTREQLLQRVKDAVLAFDAHAKVVLYGSRARGNAEPDSDWDFLVLLSVPVDWRVKRELRWRLYELELEVGEVISTVIHNENDWNDPLRRAMPFHENVTREGIAI